MRTPSQSELESKASFDDFLEQHIPDVQRRWRVAEEPLDFRLEFGAEEFIVEVTEVRLMMNFGRQKLPHAIVREYFDNFTQEVETAAQNAGTLSGTYIAHFPRPIAHFSDIKHGLKADLLSLLEDMKHQPSGTKHVFLRHAQRQFTLEKLALEGATVQMSGPHDSRWEGEARRELCEMVNERVIAKSARTKHRSSSTILLLDERNPFAVGAMYAHCQPANEAVSSFHSIYVRRPGVTGILLRSGFPTLQGIWDLHGGQQNEP